MAMKNRLHWLSFKFDKYFIRNLIVVVGVTLVRRGIRMLCDRYLLPQYPLLSGIVSIVLGILVLFLPDGSLESLGGYRKKLEEEIEHDLEKAINIALELKDEKQEEDKEKA